MSTNAFKMLTAMFSEALLTNQTYKNGEKNYKRYLPRIFLEIDLKI